MTVAATTTCVSSGVVRATTASLYGLAVLAYSVCFPPGVASLSIMISIYLLGPFIGHISVYNACMGHGRRMIWPNLSGPSREG